MEIFLILPAHIIIARIYSVLCQKLLVLVLVHQDVFEQLLVARQHVRGVAQQDVGLQEQVVEVHRAVALAALAVDIVDIAELGDLSYL